MDPILSHHWCCPCRCPLLGAASRGPERALAGGLRQCAVSSATVRHDEDLRREKEDRGMQTPLFSKLIEGGYGVQLRQCLSTTCPPPLPATIGGRVGRCVRGSFCCYRSPAQRPHALIPFTRLGNVPWKSAAPCNAEDQFRRSPYLMRTFELRQTPPSPLSRPLGPNQEG